MWAKAWFEMARAQRSMRTTAPRTASAALVSAPLALAGSAHTAAPRTLSPSAGNGPEKHAATHGSSACEKESRCEDEVPRCGVTRSYSPSAAPGARPRRA